MPYLSFLLKSSYHTLISFHIDDIMSFPIVMSEKVNVVLLGACEAIENTVENGLKNGPVNQFFEIDNKKGFL